MYVIIGVNIVVVVLLMVRLKVSWNMSNDGVWFVSVRFVDSSMVFVIMIGCVLMWFDRLFYVMFVNVIVMKLSVIVVEILVID